MSIQSFVPSFQEGMMIPSSILLTSIPSFTVFLHPNYHKFPASCAVHVRLPHGVSGDEPSWPPRDPPQVVPW